MTSNRIAAGRICCEVLPRPAQTIDVQQLVRRAGEATLHDECVGRIVFHQKHRESAWF